MKRVVIILSLLILLSSFTAADILFTQQVKPVYNLGDTIVIPVTIKTLTGISGIFQMDLICNGTAINFYKNGISLLAGEEKSFDSSLVLIGNMVGNNRGICKIKAMVNNDYALTNEFKISDSLSISGKTQKTEFDSGESVSISGKVTKETGENSNGFVELDIPTWDVNQNITQFGTITAGVFSINISLPSDLKAGNYLINLRAFEKDSDGIITNHGFAYYNLSIRQVPANLELIIDSKEIMPGSSLKIRAILHDQTGDSINSNVFITIKDNEEKILEQKEVQTNESFEYPIKNNELPAELNIFATSNKLTAEDKAEIAAKEDVSIEIVNKTLSVTNTGNVPYNKTLLVKVGDSPVNVDVSLGVGESKKYILTAPDGEYKVQVVKGNGDEISQVMSLTGDAIDIREASGISLGIMFWIVLIVGLAIALFIIFRKVYKKPFFGRIRRKRFKKKDFNKTTKMPILRDNSIMTPGKKAEVSLSIKGEKQDASVVCLKIKNLKEMKSKRGSPGETIEKIIDVTEDNKAVTYENQDYLFFILAPAKTRTFKNEITALNMAEKIKNMLEEHNRMFNQKIEFGISLNHGAIVAKIENGVFKFMAMGTLVTAAKKIASLAKSEILLGEKINDMLRLKIRTEKSVREGVSVFSIKEIKRENEEAKKFIDKFMNRQQERRY